MRNKRDLMGNTYWGWDPDDNKFEVQWPVVEDLSFGNSDLQVAADGGFPLGDLNWWGDDVKSDWEQYNLTSTAFSKAPSNLESVNILPNPSSNFSEIAISLKNHGHVEINVHGLNGAKVATIHKGNLAAGTHNFTWNIGAHTTTGTYLVRISMEDDVVTKKIVVQK